MKSNFILRKEQNPQQPTRRINCKSFNIAWLIMFLLSFTMWQCQKDEYKGETTGVCPEVLSTDPARNAKDVIANNPITATFNETMNASTITTANFLLTEGTNSISGLKQAAVAISGVVSPLTGETAKFTFTPTSELAPFTLYTATIKKGVKDPMNNMLQEDYSWSFTTQPRLSLSAVPQAGGTITGGGLFNVGTPVTATVVPNAGFVFANWTEAGVVVSTNTVYPFEIAGNRTLVANFVGLYTVTLSPLPLVGGTVSGAGAFNDGVSAIITAEPSVGYSFINWTEGATVVSAQRTYTFPVTASRVLVANFEINRYALNVTAVNGTVVKAPTQTTYSHGTSVLLTATPALGYTFTSWSGDVSGTTNPMTVIMNSEKNITANFAPLLTVKLSSNPLLSGTTTGSGSFKSGTSVTLSAVPANGFSFVNWTEGTTVVSSDANYTFNINENKTFVANFTAELSKFTVGLSSNPLLGGTTTGNGSFDSGASVTISAVPASGFTFTNWTEGTNIVSLNANYTFNINENKTFVANFKADEILPSGPMGIDLGSAGDFAILAGSGVSNTGVSTIIKGDVGAFPTATMNGLLAGNVNGILYMAADPIVGIAKNDLTAAYNDGQSRSLNAISLPGQIGGQTLAPGLYVNSSTSGISGTGSNGILTLDAGGNADAVWIFKVGSTFITDANTSIVLAGGAQAKNIYWSVGTSATLGTNSIFYGNILADQAITLTTGATLYGRALTRIAAVTLDSNIVTKP